MAKFPYKEKPSEIHAHNLTELKERIKSKNIGGSYIFYGDEDYTKNHYFNEMCPESAEKSLNVTNIYEEDFSLNSFMDACSTGALESVDMFSLEDEPKETSIRVLRLIKPNLSVLSKKDEEYFLSALDSLGETVVVFWFNPSDTPSLSSGIYKKIAEKSLVVNFKREQPGSGVLVAWILRHFSRAKINADRANAVYMCNVVGNDMTLLKNEIDKCIDYLRYENRDTLANEDIDFLCIKSTEAQVFDVSNAALRGEFVKALHILNILKSKNQEPIMLLSVITSRINELCMIELCTGGGINFADIAKRLSVHEYAVKTGLEIIRARSEHRVGKTTFLVYAAKLCSEYDVKLKTTRSDGYGLLQEMIFKLARFGKVQKK